MPKDLTSPILSEGNRVEKVLRVVLDPDRAVCHHPYPAVQEENLILLEVSRLAVAKEFGESRQIVPLEKRLVPHEGRQHHLVLCGVQVASLAVYILP